MNSFTPQVDWHPELRRLDAAMAGPGAVVRIEYDGDWCAWHRFNAVLKQRFAKIKKARLSIRISKDWHTTHLLEDLLDQFERKISLAGFSQEDERTTAGSVNVLRDIEIHGDGEVSVGSLHLNGPNPYELTQRRANRVEAICRTIQGLLSNGGRVMVVMNHATAKQQAPFWAHFWNNALESLVEHGLLFLQLVDRRGEAVHPQAPDPNIVVILPNSFEEESRWCQAYDDIIDILRAKGVDAQEAAGAANGLLASNLGSVTDLYNSLFALLLRYDSIGASE